MNHVLAALLAGLASDVFVGFLMKHHIYRASFLLENDLNADSHRDLHLMRFFRFPTPRVPQASCTLTQLCLGVNGSQMGGVIRVSCFGSKLLFLSL